jgi:hypothetical protein
MLGIVAGSGPEKGQDKMWILKGASIGALVFLLLTMLYVTLRLRASGARAIGTTALYAMTVYNPIYWIAGAVVLVAACASFRLSR